MKTYVLEREITIPYALADAFAFFEDPRNLERITPPWMKFRILTAGPIEMRAGACIEYTIRVGLLPLRWKTRITKYEPPFYFVDVQEKGPYRLWRHTHTFRPSTAGTVMTDRVEYALPFGWLGRIVHWVTVRRQVEAIFAYRNSVVVERVAEHLERYRATRT